VHTLPKKQSHSLKGSSTIKLGREHTVGQFQKSSYCAQAAFSSTRKQVMV
jgi:hypothetical protein